MWQALFSLFMLETLIKQLKIGKSKGTNEGIHWCRSPNTLIHVTFCIVI